MNRIEAAILRVEAAMMDKGVPLDTVANGLNMPLDEFVRFQELKSHAVSNGILSVEEGMTIYNLMGNYPSVFNGQPYAEKAALTNLFSELLKAEINGRR
jgi:hypothetical protein